MTSAEVYLWSTRIGAVAIDEKAGGAARFEYDRDFVAGASGIEPAPLTMPRTGGIYTFPDISDRTFRGLPGLLSDSLPDRFGTNLLDRWFAEKGRNPEDVNIVERLLYMGNRGMGALTFRPSRRLVDVPVESALNLDDLAELANAVTSRDSSLHDALSRTEDTQTALDLIRVGTSAGGARAKALVAEEKGGRFLPGHTIHEGPHRYWLMKFDGIDDNADRDGKDPPGMTVVEYIYSLMAREAGITMPDTRLLESGNRRHFLIERFDRTVPAEGGGEKPDRRHYSSWCGMAHAHRDRPGAYGYEQLALACRRLALPHGDMEELFRRAVFNIVGVNHDDHTKNFGFLMDRRGGWRMSPAFDLTYACDPSGRWTKEHQSSLAGKTAGHSSKDLVAFAEHCNLGARDAGKIIDRVRSAFAGWKTLAVEYGVPLRTAETITAMQDRVAGRLDS